SEDAADPPYSYRPRLDNFAMRYTSKRDILEGPLRTTSQGNLIEEETGDWLLMETPAEPGPTRTREFWESEESTGTPKPKSLPVIDLPEAKNGATGLDDPRTRKPLARTLKNALTGSNRPPREPYISSLDGLRAKGDETCQSNKKVKNENTIDVIEGNLDLEMKEKFGKVWKER
ncbi:hypothetical protein BS50DRAFT_468288, partial [Corynespora cassiicola Philippines]